MTQIVNTAVPTQKKKEKTKAHVVHLVKATKSSKIEAILAPRFGMSAKQVQRVMNDANESYEAWRREGFKGAWWKRYFKESGSEA